MIKYLLTAFLVISFIPSAFAYEDDLNALLKAYVNPAEVNDIKYSGVDYDAWSQDKRHQKVRQALQTTKLDELKTDKEKLAFWINAYNFFTIDLIIQRGERDSIKDLGGVFETPWQRFKWSVDGKQYTLDNIEHDIIRKFGDARIHFAINCAAKSCPDLRAEAYTAKRLNGQLEDQVRKTLQNQTKGFYQTSDPNVVKVSKVMKWFDEDFKDGNLRAWLKPYLPLHINPQTKIEFLDYDWSLNSSASGV